MAEISTERLAAMIELRGLSQSELARQVGLKQPSIGRLLTGETRSTSALLEIANALGTSPEYLTGQTDEQQPASIKSGRLSYVPEPNWETPQASAADLLEAVMVPQLAMGYSMGGGSVVEEWEQTRLIPFPKFWLGSLGRGGATDLFIASGQGDSMVPTLLDGDLCLIDRAQQRMDRQDGLWCLTYGGFGMIKRVRAMADGGYQINSDNPAVSPITAYDDEMHLVGRVVWIMRKA